MKTAHAHKNTGKQDKEAKLHSSNRKHPKSSLESAANDLLNDGKKLASALYENSKDTINIAEGQLKEYSDDLLKKVQHNPMASILIAGGIGFILSSLLRK